MSNPAEQMEWKADLTKLHGKIMPRSTAAAPDMRTAIEIVGPPEKIRQLSVVGQIVDARSAEQTAAYMVMAVRLILPEWTTAPFWLADNLRIVVRRGPQKITMYGWKIMMGYLPETKMVTLQANH